MLNYIDNILPGDFYVADEKTQTGLPIHCYTETFYSTILARSWVTKRSTILLFLMELK